MVRYCKNCGPMRCKVCLSKMSYSESIEMVSVMDNLQLSSCDLVKRLDALKLKSGVSYALRLR
jgi:hypothetical protein